MRVAWALAFFLLSAAAPTVNGQAAVAPSEMALLEDGSGDPQAWVAGTPTATNGRWAALDVVSLAAQEAADAVTFTLGVADLQANPEAPFLENVAYRTTFLFGTTEYLLTVFRSVGLEGTGYFARISLFDPATQEETRLSNLNLEVDAAAGLLAVAVPRDLFLDENGANPFPGRVFADFQVTAQALGFGRGQIDLGSGGSMDVPRFYVEDRMPDQGNGTVAFPFVLGLAQTGHALLQSDIPVRASNGEASTFVFTVRAFNTGEAEDRFTLAVSGAPTNWEVSLPVPLVEIPAGANVTVPVLITTPFAHQHGQFQDFLVTMQSLTDPASTGRVQLGIRYNAIPQPAGHHDTIFFHSSSPDEDDPFATAFSTVFGFRLEDLYMNALDEDEEDDEVPVAGGLSGMDLESSPPRITYRWDLPLAPALVMGLDLDLARTGTLRVPVQTTLPLTGASLSGALLYRFGEADDSQGMRREGDDRVALARIEATPPADVGLQGEVVYETAVTPLPAGDYISFAPESSLTLRLNLSFTRVDPFFGPRDAPLLAPGGQVTLPLFEYRDEVDDAFQSLASVMLQADGPQEALVNPGKTAVFRLGLMNHAEAGATFDLALTGTNPAWARILGSPQVFVASGETREVAVAVTVPTDALDGDVADLILQAAHTDAPAVRTLTRLVATVDTDEEHPDQATDADTLEGRLTEKESPGLPAVALLGLLAAVVMVVRRRT